MIIVSMSHHSKIAVTGKYTVFIESRNEEL